MSRVRDADLRKAPPALNEGRPCTHRKAPRHGVCGHTWNASQKRGQRPCPEEQAPPYGLAGGSRSPRFAGAAPALPTDARLGRPARPSSRRLRALTPSARPREGRRTPCSSPCTSRSAAQRSASPNGSASLAGRTPTFSPRRHDRGASRSLPPTRVRWDAGRAGHARQGAAPGSDFASSLSHCATAGRVVSCRCRVEGLRHFLGAVGHQRLLTAGTLARLRGPRERNGGLPSGRSSEEPRAILARHRKSVMTMSAWATMPIASRAFGTAVTTAP